MEVEGEEAILSSHWVSLIEGAAESSKAFV